jgi:hypothetical protein
MKTINENKNAICWTSACAILLLHIQNASYRICPPFYYERRLSHNDRLLAILSETENERDNSLSIIKEELFIYRYFAKHNPQTVTDWNKTAIEGKASYQSATAIEIGLLDALAEPLLQFINTTETSEYVHIHNTLLTTKELQLFELFRHIAIQVNYLKD